jgi:hypothetical protein
MRQMMPVLRVKMDVVAESRRVAFDPLLTSPLGLTLVNASSYTIIDRRLNCPKYRPRIIDIFTATN